MFLQQGFEFTYESSAPLGVTICAPASQRKYAQTYLVELAHPSTWMNIYRADAFERFFRQFSPDLQIWEFGRLGLNSCFYQLFTLMRQEGSCCTGTVSGETVG